MKNMTSIKIKKTYTLYLTNPKMLPLCCQSLNNFACNPHKYWVLMIVWITQTLFRVRFFL